MLKSALRWLPILLLAVALPCRAQVSRITNDTATPIPGVGHDYIKFLSETVNPSNGSVSLRIQIPTPKGRGLTIPFSFAYDSNTVHHLGTMSNPWTPYWLSNTGFMAQGGWSYAVPSLGSNSWNDDVPVVIGLNDNQPIYEYHPCLYTAGYTFRDLSGGLHSLGLGSVTQYSDHTWELYGAHCRYSPVTSGGDPQVYAILNDYTPAMSGYPGTPVTSNAFPVTVYDASGTTYYFDANYGGGIPNFIEDRNGNKITATLSGNGFTFTDPLGRAVLSASGFGSADTVTFGGQNYAVTWTSVTANSGTIPSQQVDSQSGVGCSAVPPMNDTQNVISQITLPNGQQYKFYYGNQSTPHGAQGNNFGLLSEVDYPSGAWVTYTWKLSDTMDEIASYAGFSQGSAVPNACVYQYKRPVVAQRQVRFGGTSPSLTQTFSYSTTWSTAPFTDPAGHIFPADTAWTQKTADATTTDNVTGKTSITNYTYSPFTNDIPPFMDGYWSPFVGQTAVESSVRYSDSALLQTVNKTWQNPHLLTSEQTVLDSGQSKKVTFTYTSSTLPQLQEKDEYDYDKSSPTRRTISTYQSFSGTPGVIADAPCKTLVQDGSGFTVAETDYFYDGSSSTTPCTTATSQALPGSGSYTGHDESNFGTGATIPRGNATRDRKSVV